MSSCWFLLVQISGQKMKPEFKKVFHLFEEFGGGRRVCNRDHLSRSCQCSSLLPLPPTHPSFPLSKFWEKPGGFLCGKAGGPHLLESGWHPPPSLPCSPSQSTAGGWPQTKEEVVKYHRMMSKEDKCCLCEFKISDPNPQEGRLCGLLESMHYAAIPL